MAIPIKSCDESEGAKAGEEPAVKVAKREPYRIRFATGSAFEDEPEEEPEVKPEVKPEELKVKPEDEPTEVSNPESPEDRSGSNSNPEPMVEETLKDTSNPEPAVEEVEDHSAAVEESLESPEVKVTEEGGSNGDLESPTG